MSLRGIGDFIFKGEYTKKSDNYDSKLDNLFGDLNAGKRKDVMGHFSK